MHDHPLNRDVVVVDDDVSVLSAISKQLRVLGFSVEAFEDPAKAIEYLSSGFGKCVLLDLSMPKLNGLEVQRRIAEQNRPLAIVFLSGRGTVPTVAEAMKLGAVDFLEKPVEAEDLHRVITQSLQMVQIEEAEYAYFTAAKLAYSSLTSRQRIVFHELTQGRSNKDIAVFLGVSERTIKAHRCEIRNRLGVESVAEMVRLEYSLRKSQPQK